MYELKIKRVYDDTSVWYTADLGDNVPAINIQPNNVTELKMKKGISSQNIKLPMSDNNIRIFDHSNEFDSYSHFPYQMNECRLYQDGYLIAGKGSILILKKVSEYFECQIGSGITEFFDLLKQTPMSDTKMGYVPLTQDSLTMQAGFYDDYDYFFPYASFKKGAIKADFREMTILKTMFPFIAVKRALNYIVKHHNYTLSIPEGNFYYAALAMVDLQTDEYSYAQYEESASTIPYQNTTIAPQPTSQTIWIYPLPVTVNPYNLLTNYVENGLITSDKYIEFVPNVTGVLNISIRALVTPFNYLKESWVEVSHNDEIIENLNCTVNVAKSIDLNVEKGDSIKVRLKIRPDYSSVSRTFRIEFNANFSIKSSEVAGIGSRLPISKNLGFDYQIDLFKAVVQLYGLIVDVDNVSKVVTLCSFKTVVENKKKALDWSDKLDTRGQTFSFTIDGYAQNNVIKLKENSDDNVTNTATFKVDNSTLAKTKDLYEIDLLSTKNVPFAGEFTYPYNGLKYKTDTEVANIPLLNEDGTFEGSSAQFVRVWDAPMDQVSPPSDGSHLRVLHRDFQGHIDLFYDNLINDVLKDAKGVSASFRLLPQDIESFNQFIPIYLKQFGAYFYVNKISNYGAAPLTKCELIRI